MSAVKVSITLKNKTLEQIDLLRKTPHGDIGRSTIIESLLEKSLKKGGRD